ncbi:unnamed protein product, partial [Amoebophrya sp. A25]|eukprot:GSA25T00002947001.1
MIAENPKPASAAAAAAADEDDGVDGWGDDDGWNFDDEQDHDESKHEATSTRKPLDDTSRGQLRLLDPVPVDNIDVKEAGMGHASEN